MPVTNSSAIRICITTAMPLELKEDRNGRYYVKGLGYAGYQELIDFLYPLLDHKMKVHLTIETEECLQRLRSNLSDFATSMFPYYSESPDFSVPVPLFVSKMSFLAGYNLREKSARKKECGTVFDNFAEIHSLVYFFSLLFILSFVLVLAAGVLMKSKNKRPWGKSVKKTLREVIKAHDENSFDFRWISFLFVILCFYLATGFRSIYKTSQIIVEQPFIVDNYQKLLSTKSAFPMFFDIFTNTTEKFRTAPCDSPRGKIWAKLVASGKNVQENSVTNITASTLKNLTNRVTSEMSKNHWVSVSASVTIKAPKSILCASSDEERNELWRIVTLTDPSEGEDLLGYTLSTFYTNEKYYVRKQRLLSESHYIIKYFNDAMDSSGFQYELTGASAKHRNEQNRACSEDFSNSFIDSTVKSITTGYFETFIALIFSMHLVAFFIGRVEIWAQKPKRKPKRKNRVLAGSLCVPRPVVAPRPRRNSRVHPCKSA